MKKNMGTTDRMIRIIVAVAFIFLYATGIIPGTLGIVLIILALTFVLTSMLSFCPLYVPFGMNTLGKKHTVTKKQ